MKIRVGVAGYGLSGKTFHIPLLRSLGDDFDLRAVAAGSRVEEAGRDLPDVRIVATAEELALLPDLDLAVIATPSALHAAHARTALEAGLHVMLEKPFAATEREAHGLIDLARKRSRLLTVFHNRRFDSDFLTLRNLLADGKLGAVREAEFRWERYRPQVKARWKELPGPGSGLLWDLSPHLFDQANLLFGPFEWVMADVQAQRPNAQADDWFHVVLGSHTSRVILHAGSLAPCPGFHYRVHGERASFFTYGEDPQEGLLRSGAAPGCPLWSRMPGAGVLVRPDGSEDRLDLSGGDWRDFYRALAAALRGEGLVPVEPGQALGVLRLMEAARRSSDEGNRIRLK